MLTTQKPDIDTSHWAYRQGRTAGKAGLTGERVLTAFGLGCAKTELDANNARQWIAGFDAGEKEGPDKPAPSKSWDYGRRTGNENGDIDGDVDGDGE